MPAPIITLTTDFGSGSAYVALLKAALLRHCPEAQLVDLAHDLAGDDPWDAAWLLRRIYSYYPAGTVHLVGIDRGSPRGLLVRAGGQCLAGFDNRILGLILDAEPAAEVVAVEPSQPATFLARDLLAPLAGHLARGRALVQLGTPTRTWQRLALPQPIARPDGLHGEVLHVDRFGNLITSFPSPAGQPSLRIGNALITQWRSSYAGAPGELFLVRGAEGWVEVSMAGASAAARLGAARGTKAILLP